MAELLVIGENADALQEFYENFGGNVFLCHQAIDKLGKALRPLRRPRQCRLG